MFICGRVSGVGDWRTIMFRTERYEKKWLELKALKDRKDYVPDPPTKCFGAEYPDPFTAGSMDEYVLKKVKYDLKAPMPTIHKQFIVSMMKYTQRKDDIAGCVSFQALGYMNLYFEDDVYFYDYCASYQLANHS